jgi:hypothetical protein
MNRILWPGYWTCWVFQAGLVSELVPCWLKRRPKIAVTQPVTLTEMKGGARFHQVVEGPLAGRIKFYPRGVLLNR